MPATLMNVRLDEARVQKARELRESGVSISDLVRTAIDARHAILRAGLKGLAAEAALHRILEQYPDPPDLPPRVADVHDSRSARPAIRRRLRSRASSR
jgi:hypothetical protein